MADKSVSGECPDHGEFFGTECPSCEDGLEPDRLYLVDIPDPDNLSGSWKNVGESFGSQADAIAWAKEHLGADDEGNINVISEIGGEE